MKLTGPGMFSQFDSYIENKKLWIVTNGQDYMGERTLICNAVTQERAKQIISDLQDNLKRLEK